MALIAGGPPERSPWAYTTARTMKLIIQIPCLNEEDQLPATLADLPRHVAGIDEVEWLVVDDGSTDRTIEVARAHGVDHIVKLTNNKGLASAFQAGLDASLKLGADVIVNTDADNQYSADAIPALVAPIVAGRADMVIGDRRVREHRALLAHQGRRCSCWAVGRCARRPAPTCPTPPRASGPTTGRRRSGSPWCPPSPTRLRVAHPGRQEPGRGGGGARRHQPQDPRVPAVQVDVAVCGATCWRCSASTPATSRCGCSAPWRSC